MQPLHRLRSWLGGTLVTLGQRLADPPPALPASQALPPSSAAAAASAQASPPPEASTTAERHPAVQAPDTVSAEPAEPLPPGVSPGRPSHAQIAVFSPASREPLSVEEAVLGRSMALLKREAADSIAALGAAHALVTSARLAQVQHLRELVERGEENAELLTTLAADYQGWQNDQVRLFDAMALVLRMGVPMVTALEVIEPQLHDQARAHLASLSAEYQRGLLMEQFRDSPLNS
jgi:hypothetical protein